TGVPIIADGLRDALTSNRACRATDKKQQIDIRERAQLAATGSADGDNCDVLRDDALLGRSQLIDDVLKNASDEAFRRFGDGGRDLNAGRAALEELSRIRADGLNLAAALAQKRRRLDRHASGFAHSTTSDRRGACLPSSNPDDFGKFRHE